jgi:hypothetical protein
MHGRCIGTGTCMHGPVAMTMLSVFSSLFSMFRAYRRDARNVNVCTGTATTYNDLHRQSHTRWRRLLFERTSRRSTSENITVKSFYCCEQHQLLFEQPARASLEYIILQSSYRVANYKQEESATYSVITKLQPWKLQEEEKKTIVVTSLSSRPLPIRFGR